MQLKNIRVTLGYPGIEFFGEIKLKNDLSFLFEVGL